MKSSLMVRAYKSVIVKGGIETITATAGIPWRTYLLRTHAFEISVPSLLMFSANVLVFFTIALMHNTHSYILWHKDYPLFPQ